MIRFTHTDSQGEAIETLDRNLAVVASAGTGKTYVLVQRFLHILEHRPKWPVSSIAALTFTNAAAQQMRERILSEVDSRCAGKSRSDLWRRRAAEMHELQVSTVHAWCERFLRRFAIEAGLDPEFAVLEDGEAGELQKLAMRQAFEVLTDTEEDWLRSMPHALRYDLQATLLHCFRKRATLLFVSREFCADPAVLVQKWRDQAEEEWRRVWAAYIADNPQWEPSVRGLAAMLPPVSDPVWASDDKLGMLMEPLHVAMQAADRGDWAAATADIPGRKQSGQKAKWDSEAQRLEAKGYADEVIEALRFIRSHARLWGEDPLSEAAAQSVAAWLQLWDVAETRYEALKRDRQAVDFDDLEMLALELLERSSQSSGSRVAEYVRQLNQVLADEHQDINPIQQLIIDRLAPPDRKGVLFVVGDTKQSIYRFRQAQVVEFARLVTRLRGETSFREVQLDTSFRTHRALVAATNHLFEHVLRPASGKEHADFEAKPLPLLSKLEPMKADGPCVELHIVSRGNEDFPQENLDTGALRRAEAEFIARRLRELREKGLPTRCRKPDAASDEDAMAFRWGDAAVLLRAKADAHQFTRAFTQADIPCVWEDEVQLQDSLPVQGLLALLRHLHRPRDDYQLAAALRSILFGISDETLYWVRTRLLQRSLPLSRFAEIDPQVGSEQRQRLQEAAGILECLYPLPHVLAPERLARKAVELTGLAATCAADENRLRGDRHGRELRAFLDHLRNSGHRPLGEILRRSADPGIPFASAAGETAQDADGHVRIMTIHKSKGLEFPVVFVPQLDRRPGGGNRGEETMLQFDPEYGFACRLRDPVGEVAKPACWDVAKARDKVMDSAENKRILYVACTRAASQLILSGVHANADPVKASGDNRLAAVLEAFDLDGRFPDAGDSARLEFGEGKDAFSLHCENHDGRRILERQVFRSGAADRRQPAGTRGSLEAVPGLAMPLPRPERPASEHMLSRGRQIGLVTHDLITRWERWHDHPDAALDELATNALTDAGLLDRGAVERVAGHLRALRNSELARDIQAANARYWELPVASTENGAVAHRRIDLLYRTADDRWRIVDWKTEFVDEENLLRVTRKYLPDLAAYAKAIRDQLGQTPEASLCFLNPVYRLVRVADQDLSGRAQRE